MTSAELTRLRAERDALAAENRAILRLVDESHDLFRTACNVARDGIARGVSVDDAAKIMREAVETRIGAINVAFRNFDAAREVERVKKLEAVAVAAREMRTCLVVSGDDRVARVHETGCCGLVGAALAALDAVEARK